MSRYYCPFCSSRYQFQKTRNDGVLICGLCGDPLIKRSFINSRKIFSFIAVSAFIAPLLLMIIFVIYDFTNNKTPERSESLAVLSNNN